MQTYQWKTKKYTQDIAPSILVQRGRCASSKQRDVLQSENNGLVRYVELKTRTSSVTTSFYLPRSPLWLLLLKYHGLEQVSFRVYFKICVIMHHIFTDSLQHNQQLHGSGPIKWLLYHILLFMITPVKMFTRYKNLIAINHCCSNTMCLCSLVHVQQDNTAQAHKVHVSLQCFSKKVLQ